MDVASFQFLGFTLAAALLYNLHGSLVWRQSVLLAANLAFLASLGAGWRDYVPLLAFVATGYLGFRFLQRPGLRALFVPLLLGIVFLYVWLKRYAFFPPSTLLPIPYVTLGLSYIFFRVLHTLVDARDRMLGEPIGVVPYLNYVLNFTSIVAGPIQLYPQYAASQMAPIRPPLTVPQCGLALERIVLGFFKLRILSAILLAIHQAAAARLAGAPAFPENVAAGVATVLLYTLYLYFNFSGCTDLVIGAARFFRLELPENFNRPFSATSFIDFWSRWHMTLSGWWKTYTYTPLVKMLMSRFPSPALDPFLGVVGFFVTFFLVGVWHGQTTEFLCFGLLQGGGVSVNKLYQVLLAKALGRKRYKTLDAHPVYSALARGLTFTYVTFTLVWMWGNWAQLGKLAASLSRGQHVLVWGLLWVGSSVALALLESLRAAVLRLRWDQGALLSAPPLRAAWALYVAILALIALSISSVSTPVLYQIF